MINLILQALAGTIDKEELADLQDQFDAIDVDKNGAISLEEMRQVGFGFTDKLVFTSFNVPGEVGNSFFCVYITWHRPWRRISLGS